MATVSSRDKTLYGKEIDRDSEEYELYQSMGRDRKKSRFFFPCKMYLTIFILNKSAWNVNVEDEL